MLELEVEFKHLTQRKRIHSLMLSTDVCIIGSGPSALSLAYRLSHADISVVCAAPAPETPWKANLAAWEWELDGLIEKGQVECSWPNVTLFPGPTNRVDSPNGYYRLAHLNLQTFYLEQLREAKVPLLDAKASSIQPDNHRGYRIEFTQDEMAVSAKLVFDCTGALSKFSPTKEPAIGYQSAYGVLAEVESGEQFLERSLVLMDYRAQKTFDSEPATFLYAMHLGENRYFLEETCLASSEPVPFEHLQKRLNKRLAAMNIKLGKCHDTEECLIPLGRELPSAKTVGPIAYGAAAGMINPASGYLVGRMLRKQPRLVECIVQTLQTKTSTLNRTLFIRRAIWPANQRLAWEMYRFGLRVLCSLNTRQTLQFFNTFFGFDSQQWLGYLTATQSPKALATFMLRLFWKAPWNIKWVLSKSLLGQGGFKMLKELPQLLLSSSTGRIKS